MAGQTPPRRAIFVPLTIAVAVFAVLYASLLQYGLMPSVTSYFQQHSQSVETLHITSNMRTPVYFFSHGGVSQHVDQD